MAVLSRIKEVVEESTDEQGAMNLDFPFDW